MHNILGGRGLVARVGAHISSQSTLQLCGIALDRVDQGTGDVMS